MLDAPLAPVTRGCGPRELLRLKGDYLIPCVYHFYKDPPQIVEGERFELGEIVFDQRAAEQLKGSRCRHRSSRVGVQNGCGKPRRQIRG